MKKTTLYPCIRNIIEGDSSQTLTGQPDLYICLNTYTRDTTAHVAGILHLQWWLPAWWRRLAVRGTLYSSWRYCSRRGKSNVVYSFDSVFCSSVSSLWSSNNIANSEWSWPTGGNLTRRSSRLLLLCFRFWVELRQKQGHHIGELHHMPIKRRIWKQHINEINDIWTTT